MQFLRNRINSQRFHLTFITNPNFRNKLLLVFIGDLCGESLIVHKRPTLQHTRPCINDELNLEENFMDKINSRKDCGKLEIEINYNP